MNAGEAGGTITCPEGTTPVTQTKGQTVVVVCEPNEQPKGKESKGKTASPSPIITSLSLLMPGPQAGTIKPAPKARLPRSARRVRPVVVVCEPNEQPKAKESKGKTASPSPVID